MKLADFVTMALMIAKEHMLAPKTARRLVVGSKLAARPAIQSAWFKLLSADASATVAVLLQRMVVAGVPEYTLVRATGQVQQPNWPRYSEGPTVSVQTLPASFKLVAEALKTPKERWVPVYVSLMHEYAATIAISEDMPDTEYSSLSGHVCDVLEHQHVTADKTALEVRVLGATEDLGYFTNSLRVLTRRAYGHMYKPPQVEVRAGKAFVRGLTGTLKQRLCEDFAENLDKALQLARNLEAVGISRLNKVVAPVAPAASGPRPAVGAAWMLHNPGGRGPSHGSQGSQGSRPSGASSQGSGARPKNNMVCWFCGHKGHSKAECRKKAAAAAAAKHGPSKNGEPGGYRPPESQ
jgi:hypothetical protein